MIILYCVNHRYHPKPIELCGRFRDWDHFKRFQIVEEHRGWKIVGNPKVINHD